MNKISFRTKIEAVFAVTLLLLISVSSVHSVTRIISSTEDTVATYIRNSNGKYWEATGDNIQAAIDDLGSDGGVVWLPNATISVMQVWINESGISLIGHNTKLQFDLTRFSSFQDNKGIITMNADYTLIDGIEVDGSMIWNYSLNPAPNPNVNGIVLFDADYSIVRNCEVHHTQSDGIKMIVADYSLIEYNHVHHCGNISNTDSVGNVGILISDEGGRSTRITVQHNYVHHIREHGIKAYEYPDGDKTLTHHKILFNRVEYCNMGDWDETGYPYGYGICSASCGNIIKGNIILQNKLMETGIVATSETLVEGNTIIKLEATEFTILYATGYNVTITGNHLDGFAAGADISGIFIRWGNNFTICNNVVKNIKYTIFMQSYSGNLTGCIISGNQLHGNYFYIFDKTAGYNVRDNLIINNDFTGLAGGFLLLGGATLENNTVKDNIGYDYSSSEYIPTGASSPYQYKTVSAGAMWFNTVTNILGIYGGSSWIEFDPEASVSGSPSLARIRNSNNNSWAWDNTMAPIKAAMDDLNNKSGWVKLPPPSVTNTRINDGPDITSTILLSEYCTLYCNDNWFDVKLGKYEHAFEMNIGSVLKDCHVNAKPYYTSNGSLNWEGAAVFVNGSRHFKWEYGGDRNCRVRVENLYVEADYDDAVWRNNATGLYLSAEGGAYSIQFCIFENIFTQDCKYGIKMMVSGGAGCNINNNYFINCMSSTDEYAIYMNGSSEASTEIAQNNFERCAYQCDADDSGDSPNKGIVVVEGPGNRFEKYMFWDMTSMNPSTAVILQLESSTENTFFEASGALLVNDSLSNPSLNGNCVVDNGTDNLFFMIGYSDFWLDGINARHLQTDKINCWSSDSTGDTIEIFKDGDTDVRPSVIISGDVSDTDYEGTLKIESDGDFSISSSDSRNIDLVPSSEIVTIDDILQLVGRTTDPSSLADGMIWYNTTADLFYCRAGGATYTFNLTAV